MLRALLPLLLGLALAGCPGRAETASDRLRDAVIGYNDALRFGRPDLALEAVASDERTDFAGGHYRWGRSLDVAEYEIVNVQAAGEELEQAVSFVTLRWTVRGEMIVRESLLRQVWAKRGGRYVLVDETVVDGDASLLEVPAGFRMETSGLSRPDEPGADAGVDAGAGAVDPGNAQPDAVVAPEPPARTP